MPRADYIYLVRTGDLLSIEAIPVAGFTVKHELISWLRAMSPALVATLKVFRMRDGGFGHVIEMDIYDLLRKEG